MQHLDDGVMHALLDGELPSAELTEVERHLQECESCRDRMTEARVYHGEAGGMLEELDRVPALPQPAPARYPAFVHFVAEIPERYAARKARSRLSPWIGVTGLAAAAILAVAVSRQLRTAEGEPADSARPVEPAAAAPAAPADSAPTPTLRRATESNAPRSEPKAKATGLARVDAGAVGRGPARPAGIDTSRKDANALAARQLKKEVAPAAAGAPSTEKAAATAPPPAPSLAARNAVRDLAVRPPADSLTGRIQSTRLRTAEDESFALTIGAEAAIKALGGSIRLVDGLTPVRYEQQGNVVRVIYRTAWGTLALEQWRAGNVLARKLIAPPGAPEDTVGAWIERIR